MNVSDFILQRLTEWKIEKMLNGLYDAKLDHQPVIAIIGQQKGTSL